MSLAGRVRYRFDNLMARGTAPLIGMLVVLDGLLVLVIMAALALAQLRPEPPAGEGELTFLQLAYRTLLHTIDPAAILEDRGSGYFVFAMLLTTVAGIFIVSTLIGVISSGIDRQVAHLRRGRSLVLERDHTLILGWSAQIFPVVQQLVEANQGRRPRPVVVLAPRDKVAMDEDLRSQVRDRGRTRIITRTGDPLERADLEIGNPDASRSILVLPPESESRDMQVIKTILALTNSPERRAAAYHIVAPVQHPKNLEVARLVGKGEAKLLLDDDIITRITAQTCRQIGLSAVYMDLLDFEGDEIYFRSEPALAGKAYAEALMAYEHSAVIGLRAADGSVTLNPPRDTVIDPDDALVVISEREDTIQLTGAGGTEIEEAAIKPPQPAAPAPERTLVLGWNQGRARLLDELDNYVGPGSAATVVDERAGAEADVRGAAARLANQEVSFQVGDTADRHFLETLDLARYDHVIVLSDSDTLKPQQADAHTLVTLLHLRDLQERGGFRFSVVTEMLDLRNRQLAAVTRADDFIVSDHLVSLLLAQLSENPDLAGVYEDLFNAEGAEIYLRPAEAYVEVGRPLNFYTVVEAAARRGETAIGYRQIAAGHSHSERYGVRLNPRKTAMVTLQPGDRIVVLAED
jgi:voltage-gated potassium channel Kch